MKIFNSIQIVSFLASSPIWLNALRSATFAGAGPLFCLGCVVALIFFVWAIVGVAETMS